MGGGCVHTPEDRRLLQLTGRILLERILVFVYVVLVLFVTKCSGLSRTSQTGVPTPKRDVPDYCLGKVP